MRGGHVTANAKGMVMEGFELFTGGRGFRSSLEPQVSLARNGTLTVNKAATALWGDPAPDYIQLLYNRKSKTIALRPCNEGEAGCYRLRPISESGSRQVGAKSFAEAYGIDLSDTHKTTPRVEDGVMLFSIR